MQNEKILKDAVKTISDLTKKLEIEKAKSAERSGMSEKDRQDLLTAIAKDILRVLQPLLSKIAENSKVNGEDIQKAIEAANISVTVQQDKPEVTVNVPAIKLPDFPKIPTPVVNYRPPDIIIPDIEMPDEMEVKGWINMMGFDKGFFTNPLPVQIRDAQGNPLNINALIAALKGSSPGGGGMGSGKTDFFKLNYTTADPLPVTIASGANSTTAANIVDSSGVGYSGSNPVPVTIVAGAGTSTVAVGASASGVTDDGSAPLQGGGVARTTNPTKVSDGQIVKSSYDAVGRQLIRPLQVRGLMATAYVQISTGTETTLRAGVAGVYLDLVYILASNNSDAAVSVDIRQVTAGGVVMTLQVPANGVAGVSLPAPIPQQDTGNNWTADLPDITGTTVSFSALFSQEV